MPQSVIEPRVRDRARDLRKSRTLGEKAVQEYLRAFRPYGAHFRRETPIGPYVVDFAWLSARIVIEVDGASHELPDRPDHDRKKDAFLEKRGFRVIRVRDADAVANAERAFAPIDAVLRAHLSYPSPNPSPQGGGESCRGRHRVGATPPHEGEGNI